MSIFFKKKGNLIVRLTYEETLTLLINAMSHMSTFADMMELYSLNRKLLKDWTFIVATTESENMDLYAGMDEIEGIKDRMFTPFANGRVSVINNKIFKRCFIKNDSRARIYRCVSFDTQTISYIERYYNNGSVPYKGFNSIIRLLNGNDIGIDPVPYTLENLLFDSSRRNSVERTLFAYEMMCGENSGNEKKCKKSVKSILSMYEQSDLEAFSFTKELYHAIYLSLLKMCQIQFEHVKMSVNKKLELYVAFMDNKLCKILQPEINLAYVLFKKGSSCGFFGKIQVGNSNVLENLKNMTWDLLHLRFMDYSSTVFDSKRGDVLIPYFYTYDKRLIDVRECYSLKTLAINVKDHSVVPIYALSKNVQDIVEQYCSFEKHNARMQKKVDINKLIVECEHEFIKLI